MSHFTRVRTTLRDPQVLAAALKAVGYPQVEAHDRPQQLRGWAGRTADAEVIARREHISARAIGDFGFARGADGSYEAVIDDMDQQRNGPGWLTRLSHA